MPRPMPRLMPRTRPRTLLLALLTTGLLAAGAAAAPGSASAGPGTFAPPAPTGLRATGTTGTSVALVWNASRGAVGYEIKRDGVVTGTAEIPSAMQVGLQASTTYRFRVRAKDSGGGTWWRPEGRPAWRTGSRR